MEKKFLLGIGIAVIFAAALGIYFTKQLGDNAIPTKTEANPFKIVSVDQVVRFPDHFKGPIGVAGRVIRVDESKAAFLLGCDDACVMMPVKYEGKMPEVGSEIIVYGEVKEAGVGRYVFEGLEIEAK